ncbi:hypothetical protein BH10PSE4_BH10PSE4_45820 [soil metagenome]
MPATTTASSGNIVVPMSTILQALEGVLSPAERDALISAVVGVRAGQVQPGDLITAQFVNSLLQDVNALQLRVAALEGGMGGPVLVRIDPSNETSVGDLLTLIGSGFDIQPGKTTVLMGGVQISAFNLGSDSGQLMFQVPASFSGLPKTVDVSVKVGDRTSASLACLVKPLVPQQGGQVVIEASTAALGTITVGNTYPIAWKVDSQTLLPATYRFALLFTGITGSSIAAWKSAATIAPAGDQQITRGAPITVTANVKVPTGASAATVSLDVISTDGLFHTTSSPLDLVVGQAPAVSDPRVTFDPIAIGAAAQTLRKAQITVDGVSLSGVQVKFGQTGVIPLTVRLQADAAHPGTATAAGDYTYAAVIETPAGRWAAPVLASTSDNGVAAGSTRSLHVTVQNTDAGASTLPTFLKISAAHRPSGSSAPADFTAFIRIPIQGYAS